MVGFGARGFKGFEGLEGFGFKVQFRVYRGSALNVNVLTIILRCTCPEPRRSSTNSPTQALNPCIDL